MPEETSASLVDKTAPDSSAKSNAQTPAPKKRRATKRASSRKTKPKTPPTPVQDQASAIDSVDEIYLPKTETQPPAFSVGPLPRVSPNKKSLDETLNTIYQNEKGELPNMQKIVIKTNHPILKFFLGLLLAGAFLTLAAWAGFFYFAPQATNGEQVRLTIIGPTDVTVGATSTYAISYKNQLNIPLRDVTIELHYPDGFVIADATPAAKNSGQTEWQLGSLDPHAVGTITLTGVAYGNLHGAAAWQAFCNYRPDNFKSSLRAVASLTTSVVAVPIALSISGPDKTPAGAPTKYQFVISKNDAATLPNLELTPHWGRAFTLVSSTPPLDKKMRWLIPASAWATSTPGSGSLAFSLTGGWAVSTDTQPMQADLLWLVDATHKSYSVGTATVTTTIAQSSVNYSVAVNGSLTNLSAVPGDMLAITVHLQNGSENTIKNAVLKLDIEAPAIKKQTLLDWANLTDPADAIVVGEQKSSARRIGHLTWTAKQLPALLKIAPHADINIDLRLPLKDTQNFDLSNIADTKTNLTANAAYTDEAGKNQTLTAPPLSIVLRSDLKLDNRDEVSVENAAEVHNVAWVLTNSFHPAKDIQISASVFGDTTYASGSSTPVGTITFDPKEKKLVWKLDTFPTGVTTLTLPFTLTLNSKNPTQNQLLSKVRVQAIDSVTNEAIDLLAPEISLNQEPNE